MTTLTHPARDLLDELDGFRIEIDEAQQRADIILARPPLNVVSMPQRDQLRCAFEALDAYEGIRVIVLRAEGEHFSSGGDIKGFLEASPVTVSKLAWNIAAPARCEKPVIAAGRGYCFGVGFEISLACDFRIASETTRYALPEQRLGQIPGSGGSARLQKMVGVTRTKDIVMRSRRITGLQAVDWGISTECVADAELEKATDLLAFLAYKGNESRCQMRSPTMCRDWTRPRTIATWMNMLCTHRLSTMLCTLTCTNTPSAPKARALT